MRKYYNYPLLFLVLAATIGLFLRWQFIDPTPGVRFTWFVHSHSHVMFLGWVFNVLYLAFIEHYFPERERIPFLILFRVLLILVVAMMISFPLQGYGTYSIIFSTLHTLLVMAFIVIFFRRTRHQKSVSLWFARMSLFFFFISAAGPFSLGYLMANGLGRTVWYNFSIYFYLHFQYNGFFFFGVLSLLYILFEQKQITFEQQRAIFIGKWMAVACVPAYVLSILFAKPGLIFNIVGGAAALLQLLALGLFIYELTKIRESLRLKFNRFVRALFAIVLSALLVKFCLQLFSSFPIIATMAYELRTVVIAYLHLVLVGVITLFLLAWYVDRRFAQGKFTKSAVGAIMVGFVGSEVCLVSLPWWSSIAGRDMSITTTIFGFSVLLWLGMILFYISVLTSSRRQDRV